MSDADTGDHEEVPDDIENELAYWDLRYRNLVSLLLLGSEMSRRGQDQMEEGDGVIAQTRSELRDFCAHPKPPKL